MDSNSIIQSLWIGGELSLVEQLSIKSFISNGHEFHLYTYGEVKNIPAGTIVKDGNEILPKERIFTYQLDGWGKGSYAGFADLFRYHLLHKKGGWWVDTDVVCLNHFDFKSDVVICSSWEFEWGQLPNNCILKLPAFSDVSKQLCDISDAKDINTLKHGETGPHLVQQIVREMKLQEFVVPYYIFNPFTWRTVNLIVYNQQRPTEQLKEFLRPILKPHTMKGRQLSDSSYAVHLWNESWRQMGLSKNATYHKRCLVEKLKKRYL